VNRAHRRFSISVVATLAVALGTLSACGSHEPSADSKYCDGMRQAATDLGGVDSGVKLEAAFAEMHRLNDVAPQAVKQDWATVNGAVSRMEGAFHNAGLKISDLDKISSGNLPDGVDGNKLQALMDATQDLQSKAVTDAVSNIESNVKDECGIDVSVF
jgi:hypothetical protein